MEAWLVWLIALAPGVAAVLYVWLVPVGHPKRKEEE